MKEKEITLSQRQIDKILCTYIVFGGIMLFAMAIVYELYVDGNSADLILTHSYLWKILLRSFFKALVFSGGLIILYFVCIKRKMVK